MSDVRVWIPSSQRSVDWHIHLSNNDVLSLILTCLKPHEVLTKVVLLDRTLYHMIVTDGTWTGEALYWWKYLDLTHLPVDNHDNDGDNTNELLSTTARTVQHGQQGSRRALMVLLDCAAVRQRVEHDLAYYVTIRNKLSWLHQHIIGRTWNGMLPLITTIMIICITSVAYACSLIHMKWSSVDLILNGLMCISVTMTITIWSVTISMDAYHYRQRLVYERLGKERPQSTFESLPSTLSGTSLVTRGLIDRYNSWVVPLEWSNDIFRERLSTMYYDHPHYTKHLFEGWLGHRDYTIHVIAHPYAFVILIIIIVSIPWLRFLFLISISHSPSWSLTLIFLLGHVVVLPFELVPPFGTFRSVDMFESANDYLHHHDEKRRQSRIALMIWLSQSVILIWSPMTRYSIINYAPIVWLCWYYVLRHHKQAQGLTRIGWLLALILLICILGATITPSIILFMTGLIHYLQWRQHYRRSLRRYYPDVG
jgi:hypothetical protein